MCGYDFAGAPRKDRWGVSPLAFRTLRVCVVLAGLALAGCSAGASNPWAIPPGTHTAQNAPTKGASSTTARLPRTSNCEPTPLVAGHHVAPNDDPCDPCQDGPTVCVPADSSCPSDAVCYVDSSDLPGQPVDTGGCPTVAHGGKGMYARGSILPQCTGGGGGGGGGTGTGQTYAQKILAAALADWGMNTRKLYGAPYRNECVAAVQKVLSDSGLSQMLTSTGKVILDVPTFVSQLTVSGYTETTSPVAGDIVDLSDGHVGICTNAGCTSMVSNSSTPGTFSWDQPTATQNAAEGSGPITYYHHSP